MPSSPFPVYGKIYDTDGTTVLSSVRVSVSDIRNGGELIFTTDSGGNYLVDLANIGWDVGDDISVFSSYARKYNETVFQIGSQDTEKEINLTLSVTIDTAALYCSIDDVRSFTNIQKGEYTDEQIKKLIIMVTRAIDRKTGRTWKGVQTVTDEYYDGEGMDVIFLRQTDIQSVTSLAIDDDGDGTYTSITSTTYVTKNDGRVILDQAKSPEVSNFTEGPNRVKVSYTYGNSRPTEDVKQLALLKVANMIKFSDGRERYIQGMLNSLIWHRWEAIF